MERAAAGQFIGAQMIDVTTGGAYIGTVTVYVTGDSGIQAIGSVGGGICTHEGNGYYVYHPSQAETDSGLIGFTFVGTGAIPATIQVSPVTAAQETALATINAPSTVPNPIVTFPKDPIATEDFAIDWSDFLGDDSISSSSWSLDGGIANAGAVYSRNMAIIFLSGGSAGSGYNASNTVMTSGGRTDKRTIRINVVNR